jgi:hypothetical protein
MVDTFLSISNLLFLTRDDVKNGTITVRLTKERNIAFIKSGILNPAL